MNWVTINICLLIFSFSHFLSIVDDIHTERAAARGTHLLPTGTAHSLYSRHSCYIYSLFLIAVPCRHWVASKGSAILSVACFSVWPDQPTGESFELNPTFSISLIISLISERANTYRFHRRPPYRYVVTGGQDGVIRVWDVVDGVCLRTFVGIQGGVLCLLLVFIEVSISTLKE